MPESPYPAVNERRRKRAWNARSTGQKARWAAARKVDSCLGYDPANPHRKKRVHGLVSTGYVAALVAEARATGTLPSA
jgi:hypothetical protein